MIVIFQSVTQAYSEKENPKKIRILPTGVEPKTFDSCWENSEFFFRVCLCVIDSKKIRCQGWVVASMLLVAAAMVCQFTVAT